MFGLPFWDVPALPTPHPEHHVGSTKAPYHTRDAAVVRRNAIARGVRELVDSGYELRRAVRKKKQRLNLIRLLQQSNPSACFTIENDMRWIDKHYKLGGTTSPICKK